MPTTCVKHLMPIMLADAYLDEEVGDGGEAHDDAAHPYRLVHSHPCLCEAACRGGIKLLPICPCLPRGLTVHGSAKIWKGKHTNSTIFSCENKGQLHESISA